MKSVLTRQQRAFVRADTKIDALVIDRVCDAYDALLRDDVESYKRYMATAIAQMGYDGPVPARDRPSAVDVVKTICIHSLKDRWGCTYLIAVTRVKRMLSGA